MDVISIGKAKKVKAINEKNSLQLGVGANSGAKDVAERVALIEKMDPKKGLIERIGDISGHTTINLNKHNLRVQMLLDLGKSKLSESVVDTFKSLDGIDQLNSLGFVHDAIEGKLKIEAGLQKATIRFLKETTKEEPHFFFISKTGVRAAIDQQELKLSGGGHNSTEIVNDALQLKSDLGKLPISGKWTSDWIDLTDKVKVLKDVRLVGTVPDNASVVIRGRVQNGEWQELRRVDGSTLLQTPGAFPFEEGHLVQFELTLFPKMESKADKMALSYASDVSTIDGALMLTLSDDQPSVEMKSFERMLAYDEKEVFKGLKNELTLQWNY